MKKKSNNKDILLPAYQVRALQLLKPQERLTVSEWAEKYRILDAKSSAMPGRWNNSKTPYLIDIMNELNNTETGEIVFVKATQMGGTEGLQNMVGYVIGQDASPTMIVYPSDTLAESISTNRLKPMIKLSPNLREKFKENDSQKLELQFTDMYLNLTGSNSPANLASKAMKYLFVDEVDKFSGATKKEADPLSLAKERQKTFYNSKFFMTSTPTTKDGHIWKAKEQADVEKHYFVPCPHCGNYIELKFECLEWDKDKEQTVTERARTAKYICQICKGEIYDGDKPQMLLKGEWKAIRGGDGEKSVVAYWINTLYSPFVRFSEIAKEWLTSHKDLDKKQNFYNSWLALPWENEVAKTEASDVLSKCTELESGIVPDWAILLTGGVDVQENSVYWTIRAWGHMTTSQNIAHGQGLGLNDTLNQIMNQDFSKETGELLQVSLCLIDSGNDTESVYEYCIQNSEWALPCKGSSHYMDSAFKISKVNRVDSSAFGWQLIMVNTSQYKDMIANRLKKPIGEGCFMAYKDCDRNYAQQLTSEHKVLEKKGNTTKMVWKQKKVHGDNHYLDAEVYAFAAADILGVRTFYVENQDINTNSNDEQEEVKGKNWIDVKGDWL